MGCLQEKTARKTDLDLLENNRLRLDRGGERLSQKACISLEKTAGLLHF
jgi:hypothetical protein